MTNSSLCTAFCSIHMVFTQQQLLKVPVRACSTFTVCSKHMSSAQEGMRKTKRALYTSIPSETTRDLLPEHHCFHRATKDQNSSRQREWQRNQQPSSKGQLTQNGDLAQEFFVHLPLPQSAALLLQEREKGGRTLHEVFLWFLPTAALFFFSLPLPNLRHSQCKQPQANVPP